MSHTVANPRSSWGPAGTATGPEQALRNVLAVLRAAGGQPEHVVQLTVFVRDREASALLP